MLIIFEYLFFGNIELANTRMIFVLNKTTNSLGFYWWLFNLVTIETAQIFIFFPPSDFNLII